MFNKDYEKMKGEIKKELKQELKDEFIKELKDQYELINKFYKNFVDFTKKQVGEILVDLLVKEEYLFDLRSRYYVDEKMSFEKYFSEKLLRNSEHAIRETKSELLSEVQPKIDYINSEGKSSQKLIILTLKNF